MPAAQPIPNGWARHQPALISLLRCQPRSAVPGVPDRALARGLVALFHRLARDRGNVCAGCPIVPGVPDRAVLYPPREVCRWPAVDGGFGGLERETGRETGGGAPGRMAKPGSSPLVGGGSGGLRSEARGGRPGRMAKPSGSPPVGDGRVHAWRCAFCRHWNEHGASRPRSAAVMLQLRRVSQAGRELAGIAIPLVFGYPAPDGAEVWRDVAGNTQGSAVRGFVESRRLRRDRRPVWVRGRVAGRHVLLVGGDRADPYPLGLAEHWADLRSVGRWVTRVSCPCGGAPPCVHAQALYAQVVGVLEARLREPRHAAFRPRGPRGQAGERGR